MPEIWKDVPGYEGKYQVSSKGSVRSLERFRVTSIGNQRWPGKSLSPFIDTTGYLYVNLSDGKKAKKSAVHRLVLLAFAGQPKPGQQGCHNDGNRTNCVLSNLRWDTVAANACDRITHGTQVCGEKSPSAILSAEQVKEILGRKESSKILAAIYGVASSTIRAIRIRQNWKRI